MQRSYISTLLLFLLVLSGCSAVKDLPNMKNPNSLARTVGNFSPTKAESDTGERLAAKQVTHLTNELSDLDGKQENYDPAFGEPSASDPMATAKADKTAIAVPKPTSALVETQSDSLRFGKPEGNADTSTFIGKGTPPIIASNLPSAGGAQVGSRGIAPILPPAGPSNAANLASSPGLAVLPSAGSPAAQSRSNYTSLAPAASSTNSVSTASLPAPQSSPSYPPANISGRSSSSYSQQPTARIAASQQQQQQQQQGVFGCPPSGATFLNRASSAPARRQDTYTSETTNVSTPVTVLNPTSLFKDSDVVTAQSNRAKDQNVICTARIAELLPDDRKGSPHQRFLLSLSNGTTVLVAHNIDLAPYVPLRAGDFVTVCGEYIWNEKGGVIHYTHRPTNMRHRGGYIEYNRQTYQ